MYGALSALARGAKRVRTAVQLGPESGEEYGPAVIRFNPPDAAGDPWDNADRSVPKHPAPALRIVSADSTQSRSGKPDRAPKVSNGSTN